MQVRNPNIDFADALPHWSPNRAFAQINNAASTGLVPIETFLNKVIGRVAERHGDARLRHDAALFCAQEGHHYRQHRLFNRTLAARYPRVREFERALQADYDGWFAERSLLANAAYCEGFESLGIIYAKFVFEDAGDLFDGADDRMVRLWKWHLAEEFEHRSVAFDALRAAGGGYAWRIRGLVSAVRHLAAHGRRVADYLLAVDRKDMSGQERAASIAEEAAYRRRRSRSALPELLPLLSPLYDPRRTPEPAGAGAFLASIGAV
jgi:predicted metal-dependent hydrolase